MDFGQKFLIEQFLGERYIEQDLLADNNKKYLERIAFYRKFGYDLEKEREFIIDKSLPFSGKILEIGTGKGHFAIALAKRGYNFTTIDISEADQKFAKLNIKYYGFEDRVTFGIEDAEKLSFADNSFDTIFSINVFHHLVRPESALSEMARLITTNGKIILSDFNSNGMDIINSCHSYEGRAHDHFKNDIMLVINYFSKRGFNIREVQTDTERTLIIEKNDQI